MSKWTRFETIAASTVRSVAVSLIAGITIETVGEVNEQFSVSLLGLSIIEDSAALCPRRESNPHLRFRKPSFYPLNYGDPYVMGEYMASIKVSKSLGREGPLFV